MCARVCVCCTSMSLPVLFLKLQQSLWMVLVSLPSLSSSVCNILHVFHLPRSKVLTHTCAPSMRTPLSFACRAPLATLANQQKVAKIPAPSQKTKKKHAHVCETSSSSSSSILLRSYQTGYWRADKARMSSVSPEESPVFNCSSLLTPSRDPDSECVRLGPAAWWGWEPVESRGGRQSVGGRGPGVVVWLHQTAGASDWRVFKWCNVFCSAQEDVLKTAILTVMT